MPIPLIAAVLSSVGPTLAQHGLDLLSGFFRGAVNKGTEKVAEMIKDETGIDVDDIAENKLTDEQWGQLKEFELKNQENLLAYLQTAGAQNIELEQIHQKDREGARGMQTRAMESEDPFIRRFIYFYALLITVLTFAFIFWAAFQHKYEPNDDSTRIIDTVLGFLLGVSLSAIIQFFFGSSQSSSNKQGQIERLTNQMTGRLTDRVAELATGRQTEGGNE